MKDIYTPIYILTWNPNMFYDDGYYTLCNEQLKDRIVSGIWSCRSRQPKAGDRYVRLMQGMGKQNGIIGYGTITSEPYEIPEEDFGGWFVNIDEYRVFDYRTDEQIKTTFLKEKFPEQCWTPQGSGIRIKSMYAPDLWAMILSHQI